MLEVPFSNGFLANNATQSCSFGLKTLAHITCARIWFRKTHHLLRPCGSSQVLGSNDVEPELKRECVVDEVRIEEDSVRVPCKSNDMARNKMTR